MTSWDWVILCAVIAWLFYKWNTNLLPEKLTSLYYSNIKPALYKFGFEGSSGDVAEEIRWVESLYYLEDFKLALCKTNTRNLELNNADTLDNYSFHVNNGEIANIYRVSFSCLIAKGKNYGELELSVKNQYREEDLGKFGTYLTKYYAPINYFNSANLREMLQGFFYDIKRFHETSALQRKLYVYGAKLTPQESAFIGNWVPLIYPDGTSTSEKSKKEAYKILKKGYPNSIANQT